MILSTHILIAAAASKPFFSAGGGSAFGGNARYALIFLTALASHYLSDAIPHWQWRMKSVEKIPGHPDERLVKLDKKFILHDLFGAFIDVSLGSIIVFLIIRPGFDFSGLFPLILTIIGGILPDALSPVFWLWKKKNPLYFFQSFHHFIHTDIELGEAPWNGKKYVVTGKISQIFIGLLAILFMLQ